MSSRHNQIIARAALCALGISAGAVLPASASTRFALARYSLDGTLDESFGYEGIVITDFADSTSEQINDVIIDSQGRILAVGRATVEGHKQIAMARYLANGHLDQSFGTAGTVLTSIKTAADVTATAAHVDPKGSITVVGYGGPRNDMFLVARYTEDGVLSTAGFNADGDTPGALFIEFGGAEAARAHGVVVDDDAKIVVGGYAEMGPDNERFALARLHIGGALDNSFDGDGRQITDFSSLKDERAYDLVIDADGKIMLAGYGWGKNGGPAQFALARYNRDGTLDHTWSEDGKSAPEYADLQRDYCRALAIDDADRVVVAGYGGLPASVSNPYSDYKFLMRRYESDGTYDSSFGTNGWVATPFPSVATAMARDVAIVPNYSSRSYGGIDPRNRIILAGYAGQEAHGEYYEYFHFALAVYGQDGKLDQSFNKSSEEDEKEDEKVCRDGLVCTEFSSPSTEKINAVAIDDQARIVVGGSYRTYDKRRIVRDTTVYPWNTVAVIYYGPGNGAGSAALVGPYTLLTCGHAVHTKKNGWLDDKMTGVAPGRYYDHDAPEQKAHPFGLKSPVALATNQKWIQYHKARRKYDYGAIFVGTPFSGVTTYTPLAFGERPKQITMAGYPNGSLPETGRPGAKIKQWRASGKVTEMGPRRMTYEARSTGGASGSPVWEYSESRDDYLLVGINYGSQSKKDDPNRTKGRGIRLIGANRNVIEEWLDWTPQREATARDPRGRGRQPPDERPRADRPRRSTKLRPDAPQAPRHLRRISWQDLREHRRLLNNRRLRDEDLLSAAQLRLAKPPRDKRKLGLPTRTVLQFIENTLYKWEEYEVGEPRGQARVVIKMLRPEESVLAVEDARILLSASHLWTRTRPDPRSLVRRPLREDAPVFDIYGDPDESDVLDEDEPDAEPDRSVYSERRVHRRP